jgi:hypothetical protein
MGILLCNEVIRGLPFEQQSARGAPLKLSDASHLLSPLRRAQVRLPWPPPTLGAPNTMSRRATMEGRSGLVIWKQLL